jgi:phage terminase small subunit
VRGRKPEISAGHEALTGSDKAPELLGAEAKKVWKRILPRLMERRNRTVMPWRCGRRY